MVTVYSVDAKSPAEKAGLKAGDCLIEINGHNINDVLDYRYYITEEKVNLLVHRGPELFEVKIRKPRYDDIGLEFETFLMDEKKTCRNKCMFCFIDQLPRGMREPLYFKDDDSRMSFLMGNYITLTNMSEEEIDRICLMKTSPMNISVHTTNPELRVKMLKNRFAGGVLDTLRKFAAAGIMLNCQVVLCKNVNDGAELDRTMEDLKTLGPSLESVSIVPSGLTKFRDGLYPLEPFTPEDCVKVVNQINAKAEKCKAEFGSRLFFASDEFYIKGGLPIPEESEYEGYPQLENGVGLIRSMWEEFKDGIGDVTADDLERERKVSIATGVAAYDFISSLARELEKVCPALTCNVYEVKNDFFGENITVAGLLTGRDIYNTLKDKDLGSVLLLPAVTLRADGEVFLDDVTPKELSDKLGVKIEFCKNDGYAFIDAVLRGGDA